MILLPTISARSDTLCPYTTLFRAAVLDNSTVEFIASQVERSYIDNLLQIFRPSEVIFQRKKGKDFLQQFGEGFYTYSLEDWVFGEDHARETLQGHFNTHSLKGFGLERLDDAVVAAGACLHYIREIGRAHV